MNECFVAGEETVPARQQIALLPSLALVFAEHLHHPTVRCEMVVVGESVRHPGTVGHFQCVLPAIRVVLIRAEQSKVPATHVQFHYIPKEFSHDPGGLRITPPGDATFTS